MADGSKMIDIFMANSDADNEVECLTPTVVKNQELPKTELDVEMVDDSNPSSENKEKQKIILQRKQSQEVLDSFDPMAIKPKCPEKIIICLDLSDEINANLFKTSEGTVQPMIKAIHNALRVFALTKNAMDQDHEFALVVLHDTAVWVSEFTSDPVRLIKELEETKETMPCEIFDLSTLFDIILNEVTLPEKLGSASLQSAKYIVRAVLIYGRSKTLPTLKANCQGLQSLLSSSNFFLDILYVYNEETDDHKVQEIHDFFCELDKKNSSYIYSVSEDLKKLNEHMAALVAHPLQRPPQGARKYSMGKTSAKPGEGNNSSI